MIQYLTEFKDWIMSLGQRYHVNPLVLAILYAIGKGTMIVFLGITIKKLRDEKPIILTLLIAGLGYCLPYCYVLIAGHDLPIWIYGYIGAMFVFGAFTIWKKINGKAGEDVV
jgi:hypothetical protein